MAEQNTQQTQQDEANGTKLPITSGPFATEEEAQAGKPANPKTRLFRVTAPDGTISFAWAGETNTATLVVAKAAGYKAVAAEKAPAKVDLAAALAALSPEDRALLIQQYVPAPTPA